MDGPMGRKKLSKGEFKMKKKAFSTLCVAAIAAVSMCVGAFAAGGLQQIKAYINRDITIKLDGQVKTMADEQGARVYPISYDGTTYVPIRAVSSMLGIAGLWSVFIAFQYAKLWTAGFDWRDVFKQPRDRLFFDVVAESIDELLERTSSKYGLVIFAAKRARQINAYYSQLSEGLLEYVGPLVDTAPQETPLSIALREINEGLLTHTAGEN